MSYYDFGMIDAWYPLLKKAAYPVLYPFRSVNRAGLRLGKMEHDQAEMHRAYERYVIEESYSFYQA